MLNRLGTTNITINKTMSETVAMPQETEGEYDYVTGILPMLSEAWKEEDQANKLTSKTLKEAIEGFESLKTAADAMALAAGKDQIPTFIQPPEFRLPTKGNTKQNPSERSYSNRPSWQNGKKGCRT
ncbi:hypothetical protein BaRGS_00027820 [Batillaria attramentaria]|uniref:Uncharacterized protein n=1 Tax=Batillaria attramentaria TaxID=370345 RepID=A0ABD0K167_9CAEN